MDAASKSGPQSNPVFLVMAEGDPPTKQAQTHHVAQASPPSDTFTYPHLFQSPGWYAFRGFSVQTFQTLTRLNAQASTTTSDPIPIETAHDDMIVCFARFSFAHILTETLEDSMMLSWITTENDSRRVLPIGLSKFSMLLMARLIGRGDIRSKGAYARVMLETQNPYAPSDTQVQCGKSLGQILNLVTFSHLVLTTGK